MPERPPDHILVAEDEYLIANEIVRALEDRGAVILGPVPNLNEGFRRLEESSHVDLAVLDVRLGDDLVFPLADRLAREGVPIVFYTGFEEVIIPARFPASTVISKARGVVELLDAVAEQQVDAAGSADFVGEYALGLGEVLPELRYRARQLVSDSQDADHLVEETLRVALASLEKGAWPDPAPRHLRRLLYELHALQSERPH